MQMKYCPLCGHKLSLKACGDDGEMPYCENCKKVYFDSPSACIIALVINELDEIALLKQAYISDESYVFVAGHIISGESAEDTVIREVKEEIGIEPNSIEFMRSYVYDKKDMLMLGYIVHVKKSEFVLSDEVDEAIWVNIDSAEQFLQNATVAVRMLKEYKGVTVS